jgi:predicted nucleic acid-binding protein
MGLTAAPHQIPVAPPPPELCRVYLDTCTLIDLADATRARNAEALQLLALFQRNQNSGLLKVGTSFWAITECHSVLYDLELERSRVPQPMRGGRRLNRRDTVPPDRAALAAATQTKNNLLEILRTTTDFLLLPDPGQDAIAMWQLAMRLAEEAGIYAPDSIHVATALEDRDCKILVSDDRDLLDKVDSCQIGLIQSHRQQQFSMLPAPPPFNAYGILQTQSELPTHHVRPPAMQALNTLGFL